MTTIKEVIKESYIDWLFGQFTIWHGDELHALMIDKDNQARYLQEMKLPEDTELI